MNDCSETPSASASDDTRPDDTEHHEAGVDDASMDALLTELSQQAWSSVSIAVILRDLRGE
jgi:hypothetical protein